MWAEAGVSTCGPRGIRGQEAGAGAGSLEIRDLTTMT